LKKSCGVTEHSVSVVTSVPTSTVGPSLNLTKQRLAGCRIKPDEFHEKVKLIYKKTD